MTNPVPTPVPAEATISPEAVIPQEVKWRGSTYLLRNVEGDRAVWFNPVSRYEGTCSVGAWLRNDPYDTLNR